ncbi:MAG TPA: carboxypeptidase-like regulatory domain-containing protein [Candidatus Kapabacteria bacterium]|jgi:hypothetical protein
MILRFRIVGKAPKPRHYRGVCNCGLLFVLLILFISGCTNTTDPPAPLSTGATLKGTVTAYTSNAPSFVSAEGTVISIQGTAFQAIADTGGHFEIDNVPAGVYNIIFSKPGFDSMVYPVHHILGAGTDIIEDAYLVQESNDSVAIVGSSAVFTVSVTKHVLVYDTTITDNNGIFDTTWFAHDSTVITYDTVEDANEIILNGKLFGNEAPGDLLVYSSLDGNFFPTSPSPENASMTEDAWLESQMSNSAYRYGCQSPKMIGNAFSDTLALDTKSLLPYSLPGGTTIYIYIVGHSNMAGLPATNGEYQHFSTVPYGPQAVRITYQVP